MENNESVSVATDASSHGITEPQNVSVGLVWSVPVVRAGYQIAQATGQAPLKRFGVFLLAQSADRVLLRSESGTSNRAADWERCPCVLRLDLGLSESGKMKSEPQPRRSSQRGLDPGTWGCVSQRIRVPLDTECSVSHAVTDAVRGLTSIYMIGLGLLCPEPCHPDIKD